MSRVVESFFYGDEDGAPLARVDRIEPGWDGAQKAFLPYCFQDGGYAAKPGLNGTKLPLYHLGEVRAAIASQQTVFVTEGEGKCDRLRDALHASGSQAAVTTASGGASAPFRADHVAALRGAEKVVLLADSDEPGRRAARGRGQRIADAHPTCDLRVVDLFPNSNDGSDVADWLAEGHTLEDLLVRVDAAPRVITATREAVADKEPPTVVRRDDHKTAPTFVRAGDLLAESESDELPCVVDGLLLLGGTAILAGRPKGGKSTLAANLAVAVARGETFVGRGVRPGPVLYLALEGARAGWRQLLRRLGVTRDDDLYVCIDRAPEGALQWLREAIAKHRPVLVIIDTMQRLLRVRDGNDYAVGSNATDAVIQLARECGAALLMLHHSGKTRHGDIVDEVMGSTAYAASVDTVIVLRRIGDRRTIASDQRFGAPLEETVLQMDEETHRVSPAGPKREADLADAQKAIVAYLREHVELHPGDPAVDEETIGRNVEGRTGLKRKGLRAAVAAGEIERVGTGKKGDPYQYAFPVPLVPTIGRERENEDGDSAEKVGEIELLSRSQVRRIRATPSEGQEHASAAAAPFAQVGERSVVSDEYDPAAGGRREEGLLDYAERITSGLGNSRGGERADRGITPD